jgi:CRP/FNR family transcriptional regulator, cyclic AMP receptor protein
MDTTGFFDYPTLPAPGPAAKPAPAAVPAGGVASGPAAAAEEDWDAVLEAAETLRFAPGEVVLRAGERDRAFYLLLDGHVEVEGTLATVSAPATLGVVAFLDGSPRAVTLVARTHGVVARLSWEAYEALAARDPRAGRAVLLDLAQGLGARLRAAGHAVAGWTG